MMMKAHTNSKTLTLALAATALLGALFTGNASAMADPSHRYPLPQAGEVKETFDARKTGMRFVGEPVGWIRLPGAAGTTRTVDLVGRVIEGRGLIFAPEQGE